MKYVLGNYLLLLMEKLFRCYEYTDPGAPPVVGGTGLYNVNMHIEVSTFNLDNFHDHLPIKYLSLTGSVILLMMFPVVSLVVPPCWYAP